MADKNKYFGRYSHRTGFYTDANGKRVKMSWSDYLNLVAQTRGLEVAHRIEYEYKKQNKKKASTVTKEDGTIAGLKIAVSETESRRAI